MLYFAYGSNLWQPRLECRVGPVVANGIARLDGHGLRWHKRSSDRSTKCDIVPATNEFVLGVVYSFPDAKLAALDEAEGAGKGYDQIPLKVVLGDALIEVVSYRASPDHIDPGGHPYDWYHDLVVRGARHHGFPQDYIDLLEEQATKPDPKPGRVQEARSQLELRPQGG